MEPTLRPFDDVTLIYVGLARSAGALAAVLNRLFRRRTTRISLSFRQMFILLRLAIVGFMTRYIAYKSGTVTL